MSDKFRTEYKQTPRGHQVATMNYLRQEIKLVYLPFSMEVKGSLSLPMCWGFACFRRDIMDGEKAASKVKPGFSVKIHDLEKKALSGVPRILNALDYLGAFNHILNVKSHIAVSIGIFIHRVCVWSNVHTRCWEIRLHVCACTPIYDLCNTKLVARYDGPLWLVGILIRCGKL